MRIIRGKYGRRRFDVPKNISARPTTDFARENIFNVLENMIDFDGLSALDLFAGTGAISFEFLSRGADSVTAVEKATTQASFIRSVKDKLNADGLHLIKGDAFKFLENPSGKYDLVFADPPYDHPDFDRVLPAILASPMLNPGAIVVMEHGKDRDYSALPGFLERRTYGSVNFSIFRQPE